MFTEKRNTFHTCAVEFCLEGKLFHSLQLLLQLRENIAQDQEKSDASKSQMEQLKDKIQGIENEMKHLKASLDELRRLQGQISTKTAERSTLFTLQQQQYAALSEENEG
jgi:DNA repair protein RAD50